MGAMKILALETAVDPGSVALWLDGVVLARTCPADLSNSAALLPVATLGIWLYFWGLPMEGLLLVGATYFQAINRARIASLLTGGKLVLIGGFLWGFSSLWGVAGVWLALPTCSTLLVLVMWRAMNREGRQHSAA